MKIQIISDNPNSWVMPYAQDLNNKIKELGHSSKMIHTQQEIEQGDILVLLSCEKILKNEILQLNEHNLVIHASPLPKGKGMSPLTWQILEGINDIPVTLFEAVEALDAGDIYLQEIVHFQGGELIDELRSKVSEAGNAMILRFIKDYYNIQGMQQQGTATFYKKRKPEDSRIDINKTIAEQFNLLRIVDSDRYPAYFEMHGNTYTLKIEKK